MESLYGVISFTSCKDLQLEVSVKDLGVLKFRLCGKNVLLNSL
jgi:hypothetical protein